MQAYLVLSRKHRPQKFSDILGQEPIVTTIKNALSLKKIAHAYLFSGTRGTGKTTFARILAKVLNCENISSSYEPCNQCSSCKEITTGSSLDVLEIDGASNRGIEDIRQINETVMFAPVKGNTKIYIIDEVHMLTKEAFNALLKTLEEPPAHVKFFFATTEPHKIPNTILSRCQQFALKRIAKKEIKQKLENILKESSISSDDEGLDLIATLAQGSLRDAESLLDRILSYSLDTTKKTIQTVLGIPPEDFFIKIDQAIIEEDYVQLFQIAEDIFSQGINLSYFYELLILHFKNHLIQLSCSSETQKISFSKSYLFHVIDFLGDIAQKLKTTIFEKTLLEISFLHLLKNYLQPEVSELLLELKKIDSLEKKDNKSLKEENTLSLEENENIIKKPYVSFSKEEKIKIDTLLQFTLVEFEGTLKRTSY